MAATSTRTENGEVAALTAREKQAQNQNLTDFKGGAVYVYLGSGWCWCSSSFSSSCWFEPASSIGACAPLRSADLLYGVGAKRISAMA
jgi:hypothetical protein